MPMNIFQSRYTQLFHGVHRHKNKLGKAEVEPQVSKHCAGETPQSVFSLFD